MTFTIAQNKVAISPVDDITIVKYFLHSVAPSAADNDDNSASYHYKRIQQLRAVVATAMSDPNFYKQYTCTANAAATIVDYWLVTVSCVHLW